MIVKKIAFGNHNEAFIEDRFKDYVNIIFSNDNNRGKTLLMQSIVYSIGYESIFPSGFNTKAYYFYSHIEYDNRQFQFLRKRNSVLVIDEQQLHVFNSITEFKYFFDKEIFELPKIDKGAGLKTADLSLFYELFFLGQDKRNTSNLIVKGLNNKADFLNMIYSYLGYPVTRENKYDVDKLKKDKVALELKIKAETKKISIIKSNPEIATFVSAAADNLEFKKTSTQLDEIHRNIAELKKNRSREESRKIKLEALVIELNSLNISLNEGKVRCSDCGSDKILFSNSDFDFEVSNSYVRQKIIQSINENIRLKSDVIKEFNTEILREQEQINRLLDSITPEAKNYILFRDDYVDSREIDKRVLQFQNELAEIEQIIKNNDIKTSSDKNAQRQIVADILDEMKRYYQIIDPHGLLRFEDVFTKGGETYSGSEEQEYYFCKILALNNVLNHGFPIIIDSFREGELSSSKEEIMIDEYKKLGKQVILTSTLKDEEYTSDKYYNMAEINVIDYSQYEDSKILQQSYVKEFIDLVERFGISI